ncbi:MAG: hypothetical protein H7228_07520 [Polaromonas sp.]|nr:hypothetical protein [Polaromonas sp.]
MNISKKTPFLAASLLSILLAACGGSSAPDGTVSGTVSGLGSGLSLALQNNGTDTITVTSNGVFAFPTKIASLGAFSVSVLAQPVGQFCSVTRASGVIPTDGNQANITIVACVPNTIGVNVSGLASGASVILANAGVTLTIAANGLSSFSGILAAGTAYSVTVNTQPASQTCTLSNASGTAVTGVQSIATLSCI